MNNLFSKMFSSLQPQSSCFKLLTKNLYQTSMHPVNRILKRHTNGQLGQCAANLLSPSYCPYRLKLLATANHSVKHSIETTRSKVTKCGTLSTISIAEKNTSSSRSCATKWNQTLYDTFYKNYISFFYNKLYHRKDRSIRDDTNPSII